MPDLGQARAAAWHTIPHDLCPVTRLCIYMEIIFPANVQSVHSKKVD